MRVLSKMRCQKRRKIEHTDPVMPKRRQRTNSAQRVRCNARTRPKHCGAVLLRGLLRLNSVPKSRTGPSDEYGLKFSYKGLNVSSSQNALLSKPVSVMRDWSQPDPRSTAERHALGPRKALLLMRPSHRRRASADSLSRTFLCERFSQHAKSQNRNDCDLPHSGARGV